MKGSIGNQLSRTNINTLSSEAAALSHTIRYIAFILFGRTWWNLGTNELHKAKVTASGKDVAGDVADTECGDIRERDKGEKYAVICCNMLGFILALKLGKAADAKSRATYVAAHFPISPETNVHRVIRDRVSMFLCVDFSAVVLT